MPDFWIPNRKYKLVDALVATYGEGERSKLNAMSKKQLYAIWFKTFRRARASTAVTAP